MLKQRYFIHLLLFVLLCMLTTNAMAKPPSSSLTSSCLSNKELNMIAKQALPELQAIDPSVTLTDVKNVIKSTGDCASLDEINAALAQYSDELSASTGSVTSNTAPTISGTPDISVTEEIFYIFTPIATDADNDTLSFSASNLPSWASFDATTGAVYGTPMNTDIGSYDNISIKVSDGTTTASLPAFNIEVLAAPVAIPDNPLSQDVVSYSIYMGPSQDALTLQTTLDTGSSVTFNTSLTAADTYFFAIVAHDANGNNSFVSNPELIGFRIYAGTSSDGLLPATDLSSGADTVFQISGLDAGTFYLSVTAFDSNGNEAPLSNMAQILLM
jgi:hypothetical protein